ncbi:uncharacterized protein LOC144048568 [Vanacampus margaritifer]
MALHEETEIHRKQLDAVDKNHKMYIQGVQQVTDRQDELLPQSQAGTSSLEKENPQRPCIKEEKEDVEHPHVKDEEEEADISKFPLTIICVKSEDDEDEPAEASQLRTRSPSGGPQQADLSAPQSDCDDTTEEPLRNDADGENDNKESKCSEKETPLGNVETVCVKHAAKKQQMKTHAGEKPFSCPFCGKTFSRKEHVQAHVRIHTGEKPFSCSTCGKAFPHKETMIAHVRSHTGENPFRCSVCGKTYSRKTHVESHMRTHTGEKPFPCSVCGKMFSQKPNMVKHMRIHTGERPFCCLFCDKAFLHKSHVESHMKIHTGEKPFSCSVCEQTFSQKQNLVSHMRTHTGEKPYSCSVCGGSFAQSKTLTAHMRRRHDKDRKMLTATPPQ